MNGKLALIAVALFAAGYGVAWNQYRPPPPVQQVAEADILARVGDRLITRQDFDRVVQLRRARSPMLYRDRQQQEGLLAELVERASLLEAAQNAGVADDPYVQEACERAKINLFVKEKVEKALADTRLTDEEIQAYYQLHQDEFAIPARYKPAIILLAAPPDQQDEAAWARLQKQAEEILQQARQLPEDLTHWGDLARTYSQHRASRYQGGAMAWVNPLQKGHAALPDAVLDALFALKTPGEIAPPVRTDKGLFLVRLQNYEPPRARGLDEVRQALAYRLRREKREQMKQAVLEKYLGAQAVQSWPERLQVEENRGKPAGGPPAMPGHALTKELKQ